VGLGDLAVALATLDIASEAQLRVLGRCLGLGGLSSAPRGTARAAADQRWRHRRPPRRPGEPRPPPGLAPPLPPPAAAPAAEPLETLLEPLPAAQASDAPVPDWHALPSEIDARREAPPRDPLFPRPTAPGVLGAAVATRRPGPRPDIDRLIARIVRGRPSRDLPRLPVPSLSRGLQLLLDRSESMTPFFADQLDLARAFARVAGASRCEVLELLGDPATARTFGAGERPRPWRPEPGRPVVVVSDFGLGESLDASPRVSGGAWRGLADRLRRLGCPLVAVVPHPPGAWPGWVRRRFVALHWDPRTRAESVRALVGPGHEIAP
jgi:hypothetical protein